MDIDLFDYPSGGALVIYPLLQNREPDVMMLVALVNLAVNTTD